MATTFASLGLDQLDRDEKVVLVHELWDDLVKFEEPNHVLSDPQLNELKRRLAELKSGKVAWVPLDDVQAEIKRRFNS